MQRNELDVLDSEYLDAVGIWKSDEKKFEQADHSWEPFSELDLQYNASRAAKITIRES